MTSAQKNAIPTPGEGLLIYQTDIPKGFYYYNGTVWTQVGEGTDIQTLSEVLTQGNDAGNNLVSNVADPVSNQDAATKKYVDDNSGPQSSITDSDGDTKIQVEESLDEDKIRFDLEGTEHFVMDGPRMEVLNSGNSVFIGEGAGENDDLSSNWNVFIGYDSGTDNTTGQQNAFLGYRSGFMNEGGLQNTFLGFHSGRNNTSGGYNTFTGAFSGSDNTTASSNAFYGENSGNKTDTGGSNTFIGSSSGKFNVTGNNNTYLGWATGLLATGSNNVFLGSEAGRNETGSNLLYIENSGSAFPLIWGDFAANRVGVNRVAATNTLEVGGDASKSSSGSWLANSDSRLKKNIIALDGQTMIEKLISMKGVSFEWDDDKTGIDRPEGIQIGFIAQDLEKVWPENVEMDNQGYLQTAYGDYDPMFVESIKFLYSEIEQLKQNLKEKEAENKHLKHEVSAIGSKLDQVLLLLERAAEDE